MRTTVWTIAVLAILSILVTPAAACGDPIEKVLAKHEGSVAYVVHATAPENFQWVKL